MRDAAIAYGVDLVRRVCAVAGPLSFLEDLRQELTHDGVIAAVQHHDTGRIFAWLVTQLSMQGISNGVAFAYMNRHGGADWAMIDTALARSPSCSKLRGYWAFHGCDYQKGKQICAAPDHLARCPLPRLPLRNGRLNQMAYSLFLFVRDVIGGDFVSWLDRQLAAADVGTGPERLAGMRAAVVDPIWDVFGVSDKTLALALSSLLIGAAGRRPRWFETGASFIVVDTLMHNFLHRTGILRRFKADHAYGPRCYGPNGCAEILAAIAEQIDAQALNRDFPIVFPRFVQFALWRFCAQGGLNECNGNRIDDLRRCANIFCRLYTRCDRIPLR